jgi:hypothetical protein
MRRRLFPAAEPSICLTEDCSRHDMNRRRLEDNMSQPLNQPIDHINEERPPAGSDEGRLPVFVTAAVSVFLIVVMVWLFVPARVATVRARSISEPAAGVTAPPAQQVHEQLQARPADKTEPAGGYAQDRTPEG